ncbi:SAF domain-containing protein [Lentzea fradiae]|uniref:SAF domain-containing protein n=1 Tax=Lentzea fradiae TaxID=200378 RepID=A0A1G7X6L8_9PSEU|nr:SAF domain-containing protein [Lentzea fradiae]SDG79793.1 SAF domain-containing protein [Lentzea fradiae]
MTFSAALSGTPSDRVRALLRRRPSALWRRFLAAGLALLAAVTGFWPDVGHPVVVAARDVPPGVPLTGSDLRLATFPAPVSGSFAAVSDLAGRRLNEATRAGVPVTDLALASPSADTAAVAVHLPEHGLAGVIRVGDHVDVVSGEGEVLAENVPVREARGRVVLLQLPRIHANRVAATSLDLPLAVTLR